MSWTLLSNVNPNPSPLFPPHSWVHRKGEGVARPTLPHQPWWASVALSRSVLQDLVQMSHVLLNSQHAGLSRSVLQDLVQMSLGHVLLSNQHAALSCSVLRDFV